MRSFYQRIATVKGFNDVIGEGRGYICIIDFVTGNKVHRIPCPLVNVELFNKKVIKNKCRDGYYFWVESISVAKELWNASECPRCRG